MCCEKINCFGLLMLMNSLLIGISDRRSFSIEKFLNAEGRGGKRFRGAEDRQITPLLLCAILPCYSALKDI